MSQQKDSNSTAQPMAPPGGYPYYPTGYDVEDEISLVDLWRVLMARKWMIFWLTTLFTLGAARYALVAPEVYKAEAVLAPVKQESGGQMAALASQFGGLASLAGVNLGGGGGGGSTDEAIAILQSRKFLNSFVAEEQLMPLLFEDQWDVEKKQWLEKRDEEESSVLAPYKKMLLTMLAELKNGTNNQIAEESKESTPSVWDAYEKFSAALSTSPDKKSGMVKLAIEWKDPVIAAEWANQLVVRLNKHLKQEAVQQAEKSIHYLKQQLATTSVVDMQQILYRLIEKQSNTIMLANIQEEFAFRVIDPAIVPQERSKPKRKLIVVLGGVLGMMFSIFLAFFLNFLKNQKEEAITSDDDVN